MKVEIYTKPSCPYCIQAKILLKNKNVEIVEHTIGINNITKETVQQLVNNLGLTTEVRTVPQIFLHKEDQVVYIGGYTDLVAKQSLLD